MARPKRSDMDRLRSLLTLSIKGKHHAENLYTQKELAAILGISTRTLRRVKNIPGYVPAKTTLDRIRAPLKKEETSARRYARRYLHAPDFRITTIPKVYQPKQAEKGATFAHDVSSWATQDKIDFLTQAAHSGLWYAWRISVKVPPGVALSGEIDDENVNETDEDQFISIGPFSFERRDWPLIDEIINYHEDAGRIVVTIFLVEKS